MSDNQDPAENFQTQLIRSLRALIAVQDPNVSMFPFASSSKQMDVMNEVARMIVNLCSAEVQRQVGVTMAAVEAMDERVRQFMEWKKQQESLEDLRRKFAQYNPPPQGFNPQPGTGPWGIKYKYQTTADFPPCQYQPMYENT